MKSTIIYAHPYEKSFNHGILETVVKGLTDHHHDIELIDLNAENFNPVMTRNDLSFFSQGNFADPKVGEYQKKIENSDHLFFIFPIWWNDAPAILRGFFDKVFLKNWAYIPKKSGMLQGRLKQIKKATLIMTMGAPEIYYHLAIKSSIAKNIARAILLTCGIRNVEMIGLCAVDKVNDSKRKKWLAGIEKYIGKLR